MFLSGIPNLTFYSSYHAYVLSSAVILNLNDFNRDYLNFA